MTPFDLRYLEALSEVVISTIRRIYSSLYCEEIVDYFLSYNSSSDILKDSAEGHTVLCFEGEKLVGSGCLVGTNIRRLFVLPECQKMGIGSMVMKYLERFAMSNGGSYLELYAMLPSIGFYRKLGYKELGVCNYKVGDFHSVDYMRMEKLVVSD